MPSSSLSAREAGADAQRHVGVERRGRLVEHEQAGPVERGPHDPDESPLSGGELGAHRVGEVLDLEPRQTERDRRLGILQPVEVPVQPQVLAHAQPLGQREVARREPHVLRSARLRSVASACPEIVTVPASGDTTPSTISSVVVLPAPFGPSRPTRSPRVHGEIETVDGTGAPVVLDQPPGLEHDIHDPRCSQAAWVAATQFRVAPGFGSQPVRRVPFAHARLRRRHLHGARAQGQGTLGGRARRDGAATCSSSTSGLIAPNDAGKAIVGSIHGMIWLTFCAMTIMITPAMRWSWWLYVAAVVTRTGRRPDGVGAPPFGEGVPEPEPVNR